MKYGIFSDIHSDYKSMIYAFDIMLDEFEVDEIICLGDIISYGNNPLECINFIQYENIICTKGNHEVDHLEGKIDNSFNKKQIEDIKSKKNWFENLPTIIKKNKLSFTHSSFPNPERFKYLIDELKHPLYNNPSDCFDSMGNEISTLFIGHTHNPCVYSIKKKRLGNIITKEDITSQLDLNENIKTIVNVGSVSMPRNNSKIRSFAIYDDKFKKLNYHFWK